MEMQCNPPEANPGKSIAAEGKSQQYIYSKTQLDC